MKRFLVVIALALAGVSLPAQKLNEKLLLGSWELVKEDLNGEFYILGTTTAFTSYSGIRPQRTLGLNTLQWMKYSSGKRRDRNIKSILLVNVAAFEMLIVAPLVSINYKTGRFNSQRYYRWAGIGLIGVSVSIPLLLLTKEKKYLLTLPGARHDKKYWYLEKR